MAKWFIIGDGRVPLGNWELIPSRSKKINLPDAYHFFMRYRVRITPYYIDPYMEPYVTYRLKNTRKNVISSPWLEWIIKVPDDRVVEFKLKYSDVIMREYG